MDLKSLINMIELQTLYKINTYNIIKNDIRKNDVTKNDIFDFTHGRNQVREEDEQIFCFNSKTRF